MRKVFLFIVPLLLCVFNIQAQNSNADENAARSLVNASKTELGLSSEDLSNVMVSSSYYDNASGIRMVYLNQTHKGIPVYNQMLVLAYKADKLVSKAGAFNQSLEKLVNVNNALPAVSAESAVQSALSDRGLHASQMAIALNRKDNGRFVEFSNMGISRENITAQLMWTPIENSTEIRLSWHVYLIPKTTPDYWMVRVDAVNNSILGMDNYTVSENWGTHDETGTVKYPAFAMNKAEVNTALKQVLDFKKAEDPTLVTTATYRVIPIPYESPNHMPTPLTTATRTDPWLAAGVNPNATTLKWHTGAAAADYDYSRGNNTWAYQDRTPQNNTGSIAKSASSTTAFPNLTFDFVPDFTQEPTVTAPTPNQQFNITNLFYWNNVIHDVFYGYGFTEVAGNFQADNLGRGGAGNDHVNAEAQDGGGNNNANFSTPADGVSGRMQMYLWTAPTPDRDGDVDNGIVVHEYGHGISTRLTGGPANSGCLSNQEQPGEGWSDYFAIMLTQNWATATVNTGFNTPRGVGTFALNQPITGVGIRPARYTTDMAVNNYTYSNLPSMAVPHGVGFVWCTILWDMTWNIINQTNVINPNIYDVTGTGGNSIALKLVTEACKLQQCSPGFVSARNAILQADQIYYGGAYNCAIWEAFRRRGVGAFASEGSTSSTNDQVVDFTAPILLGATVSATTIPEGSNLTYTNSIATCAAVTGYTVRDTLPTNVTYVSGGTYDAPNRVVSFAVTQGAGTTNYPFVVNVNAGSYFPPVTLFNETVAGATIPASWTATTPVGTAWAISTTVSNSAPNSFYAVNLATSGDQRLATTATYALPLNSYPELSFWHRWNTEDGWDGGVVEISTNGGTTWSDLGAQMTLNGYNGGLGAAPTNALTGRAAFTGLQNTFINTKINLAPYTGSSVMLRFRFGSDDNTSAPTNPAGWWVDDITLSYKPAVNMRSSLFNAANTRVSLKDNVTEIILVVACAPTINQQPVNVTTCAGSSVSYTCVGTATGGVTYQWQLSTTGIAGAYNNLANGAPYSGVTTSTLTVNPTVVGMNGYYYRCIVTGTCNPTATSNPAQLSVAAGSTAGTLTPANTNVCGTTNSGVLTVAGFNGNVVRWESATNIAGPWSAIANTTNTYTFNNLTQTTFFRAVSQFGTCAETNSNIATVTFAAALPMVIVADPGTTLCEGDPTRLTVLEGNFTSNTIQTTFTNNNAFGLVIFNFRNNNAFPVTITGIESIASTSGISTASLYYKTTPIAGAPGAISAANGWNLINTGTYTAVANTTTNIPQVFLSGLNTLSIPAGATYGLAVESKTAANVGNLRYSTVAAGVYTISAGGCDIITGTGIGYAGNISPAVLLNSPRGFIGKVSFSGGALNPIPGGTYLWTPAAGLSSTTSNPVAASPMTTTTYTVNHNNGAGCIRQANITITVNQRPVVTTQPVASVNCVGTTATFTVGGTGTGLTYQWQERTTPAGAWNNLTNIAPYSGVTTPTLTINPVNQLMSGYAYRCVLSGTCPAIGIANISNPAILTVNPNPSVSITPAVSCGGVAGISGTLLSVGSAPPPIPGAVTVNSGVISVLIPDGTGVAATSNLTVAGIPANATITEVKVNMNINHTWVGDVDVNLRAPNLAILNLVGSLNGGTGGNAGNDFTNTAFSSLGGLAISGAADPRTGTFAAEARAGFGPIGFIQTVNNWPALTPTATSANGVWTLAMGDFAAGDEGTLTNWSIVVNYTTPGGGSGPTLTYVWSPLAGLYTNATATIPYTGTNTASVYAAPTVLTVYTVRATDVATGCFTDATALVNYTPPAPTVTANPVSMCLGDVAVKLKSSSAIPATAAVWTPAAGLFSDAAATVPYVAGTAVDSVWTRPTPSGVYPYQVTVNSNPGFGSSATIALPAQSSSFSGNVRGYWFTAPSSFTMTSVEVPTDASPGTQNIAVLRFTGATPPPAFPGTTNAFTTLFLTQNNPAPGAIAVNIPINAGDVIGILGNRGNVNSYTLNGPIPIVINGVPVPFTRMGMQLPLATNTPQNIWQESAFQISRVRFSYGLPVAPCTSPARTVVVTVNQPTTVATQPVAQTICTDKVTTFSVVAAGSGPFTYRWELSTAGNNPPWTTVSNSVVYSGATTATLTITAPPVTLNGNFYRCVITGAAPCAAATSNGVRLGVNPLPVVVITASPLTSLFPGLRTTLSSTVAPNPAATYTWLRNGVTVAGATTGTLGVDVDGLGNYTLRVTDVNGCTNTSNMITIKDSASGRCFIYPNPTSGKFQVRYYSVANNVLPRSLTIYDAKGDRVLTQMYQIGRPYDRMDVDMRAYGKGLYWVEIGDLNGNRLTICRVVIQ